jgi:selenium metabolism protein YedF
MEKRNASQHDASQHKTLDLRGLSCPEPVLRTKNLFDDPDVLSAEALVDGEINVQNLERLAGSLSLKFSWQAQDDYFRVLLSKELRSTVSAKDDKRSGRATQKNTALLQSETHYKQTGPKATQTSTVIFINKDTFGEGDREFSNHLLNLFLQTTLASGHQPKAILLANSGVKLLASQSPFLKVLDDFKSNGVEVLACGLCVEFYGLQDSIAKEQITNMFAICEYLFAADKVLTP